MINKRNIMRLNRIRDGTGQDAEREEQVAGVEGAQYGDAVQVGGEVGPSGDVGAGERAEVDPPGQREGEVAEEGGEPLVLGVDVVEG